MEHLAQQLKEGASMEELTKDMKYYSYYLEAYSAVLGGMTGTYEIQIPDESTGEPKWVTKYGLKLNRNCSRIWLCRSNRMEPIRRLAAGHPQF